MISGLNSLINFLNPVFDFIQCLIFLLGNPSEKSPSKTTFVSIPKLINSLANSFR